MTKNLFLAGLCLALAACGGREPNNVAEVQAGDDQLTCEQIHTAIQVNNEAIVGLVPEREGDRAQTAVAVVGAVVFLPSLFFMDLKSGAANEINAYVRRNEVLARRYELLNCEPALKEVDLDPQKAEKPVEQS